MANTSNTANTASTFYNSVPVGAGGFKNWSTKHLGSKPTDEMLATVHALGLRPGKQALANAMALRPEGVSGAQIVMMAGAPQLNRMRGLIGAGVVKRDMNAPVNPQGQAVYKLNLTSKGETAIKRAADLAAKQALDTGDTAKPAKAKVKAKAKRKPKVKAPAVEQVASEPQAPADQPAPQGEADQHTEA